MNDTNFNEFKKLLFDKFSRERILEEESLTKHTSFKIGGPAKFFINAYKLEELTELIKLAAKYNFPYVVLGSGTNILASDQGFSGLVIKNKCNKISIRKYGGSLIKNKFRKRTVTIEAESGVLVNQLVRFTLEENLSGLEAFLGQPGTVGGAVFMNAHNMNLGEYFGDKITWATIITKEGTIKEVEKSYFQFGYDNSSLLKNKSIVLKVTLELSKGNSEVIWKKANAVLQFRQNTQPYGYFSAGCVFRNISPADALRVGIPKGITSAGFLIDAVGLKNYTLGGAKFSEKHANFIINADNATSKDVENLIDQARQKVKQRFNINLQEEIVRMGN